MSISTDPSTPTERMEVTDTLNRMAWFQDRRRWAELADLLADEVQVGYGEPDVELVALSRADLIANWRNGLDHTSSQHVLTGITIDAAGGTAHAALNETAWIRGKAAQESLLYQSRATGAAKSHHTCDDESHCHS